MNNEVLNIGMGMLKPTILSNGGATMTNIETLNRIAKMVNQGLSMMDLVIDKEAAAKIYLENIFSVSHFYTKGCGHKDGEVLVEGSEEEIKAYLADRNQRFFPPNGDHDDCS